jgi:hypothetical protein
LVFPTKIQNHKAWFSDSEFIKQKNQNCGQSINNIKYVPNNGIFT